MWNYDFTFIPLPDKNFDLGHVNLCPALPEISGSTYSWSRKAGAGPRLLHIFQISVRMDYTLVLQRNKVLIDDKITPLM